MDEWIVWTEQFIDRPSNQIGGKARGLGYLQSEGIVVPPGFCIISDAFTEFCRGFGIIDVVEKIDKNVDLLKNNNLKSYSQLVTELIRQKPISGNLEIKIADSITELKNRSQSVYQNGFVIRSSFASEDTPETPSAGQYLSVIGVSKLSEVITAIKEVWASTFSERAIYYRITNKLPLVDFGMAVVVQLAVEALYGGVLYTINPDSNDISTILIESVKGHPQQIVEGQADPNRFIFSKPNLKLISKNISELDSSPSDEMLTELCQAAFRIERKQNQPIDIEWIISPPKIVYFLQMRPAPYEKKSFGEQIVLPAGQTELHSGKLKPFIIQFKVGLETVDAHVVLPEAFEVYKKSSREFSRNLLDQLSIIYKTYCSKGDVGLRPAYWSVINNSDYQPQSGKLRTVNECIQFTKSYWDYIIDAGMDDYSAEVALLIGNWIKIYATAIATYIQNDIGEVIVVNALYGTLEGLESNTHDIYRIDANTLKIINSSIPLKKLAVYSSTKGAVPISNEMAEKSVLSNEVLAGLAERVKHLYTFLGPVRVEFLIVDKQEGDKHKIIIWQIDHSVVGEAKDKYYEVLPESGLVNNEALVRGNALILKHISEVELIQSYDLVDSILLLDFDRTFVRDPMFASRIGNALRNTNVPVVLKGSLLSHFAATLRGYGIRLFCVNTDFSHLEQGSRVVVILK